MKTSSHIDTSKSQDNTVVRLPIKVCMHVLGPALTDRRVMREASALVEAGFEVSIVDVESEPTLPVKEEISGICINHIIMPSMSVSTRFKPWFLVKAIRLIFRGTLRLMRIPADIYHAHDGMALPACYFAARLRRKLLIFDAHELPFSYGSFIRWRRLRALSSYLLARMVPYCVGVITVSHSIAQEIRRHYNVREVSLIRNVPMHQAVSKSDRLLEYLGLDPKIRIALYQGGIQSDRGLDKLVYAAAFLERDIMIVIMGEGPKEIRTQLEALIAKEMVGDRVKIIPPVPYEELLKWTASADIGLIVYSPDESLNTQMCLPNKLFEYLMAGLPILASPLDAVANIINTCDVGQIVHSLTPTNVAAAINAMLADHAALDRMHHNALNAAQEFCWENESQRLIRLYRDILASFGEE
jgi:glycosyltransferase involved in cell wall biosynthesis